MKEGMKHSEIGLIPKEWNTLKFGELFEIVKSHSFSRNKLTSEETATKIQNIHYGDIHSKFTNHHLDFEMVSVPYIIDEFLTAAHNQFLKDGDILIADVSEDLIDIGKCIELKNIGNRKVIGGLHSIVARDKSKKIEKGFGAYIFKHHEVMKELRSIATGMSVYGISKGNLNKLFIPVPPLPEQRKIAYILSTVQKAIEQQDKLIRHTTELKKALMQKLFTVGITDYDDDTEHTDKKQKKSVKSFNPRQSVMQTRKQKQTEIGLVPESWEVVELGDVCEKPQYGFTDSASLSGNAKFLRITDITEYGVQWNDVPFCNCNDVSKYELKDGDIVFARIGATTGKSYLINNPPKSVYASYLIRVRCKKEISPDFLIYYFASEQYWKQIDSTKGNNLKGGVNGSILSKLFIPKPCIAEQNHIAKTFKTLDLKIAFNIKKKQTLTALFKTLLHELMSGQRRLHEIEFEALNKVYKLDEEPLSMVAEPLATVAKNTTDKNGSKL